MELKISGIWKNQKFSGIFGNLKNGSDNETIRDRGGGGKNSTGFGIIAKIARKSGGLRAKMGRNLPAKNCTIMPDP